MDHKRFDDFTRALAQGTSRRQALKVLGGSLLAALVPGSVLAKGGNSDCAKFCANTFGADTPAAKQCTSDAAKGKGLCYQCGPASNGTQTLCGTTCVNTKADTANCGSCGHTCTASANATATCNNGTCSVTCNAGYKECNGTCIPTSQCCSAADCQTPANATATCTSGTCSFTCNSGYKKCNGSCIPQNTCCNCSSEQVCQEGTCCLPPGGIPSNGQGGFSTRFCCSNRMDCADGTCTCR